MTDDANDWLLSTAVPSAKFPEPGTCVTGRIVQRPEVQQQRDFDSGEPLVWDDGTPRKQVKVVLGTELRDPEIPDDDGQRALYIKANLQKAVQQALRKANAKLEIGGTLAVTYTGDGEVKRRGMNAPKIYSAAYVPPAEAAVQDALDGQGEPSAPHEPAQPPRPAPGTTPEVPDLSQLTPEQIQALLNAHAAHAAQAADTG